jgi:hypothetical protein
VRPNAREEFGEMLATFPSQLIGQLDLKGWTVDKVGLLDKHPESVGLRCHAEYFLGGLKYKRRWRRRSSPSELSKSKRSTCMDRRSMPIEEALRAVNDLYKEGNL